MIQLKAWEPNPHQSYKVYADLKKETSDLEISFLILGPSDLLALKSPDVIPERRQELWSDLCFEVFIGSPDSKDKPYFELNLASNGHWNFYELASYRTSLTEKSCSPIQILHHEKQKNSFLIRFAFQYSFPPGLFFGPSLVLKTNDGKKSYWATSTIGQQPDFHLPELRIL